MSATGKDGFEDLIPYLLCLHIVTEDFFQTLVYIAVATSHSTIPFAIWLGMIQAAAFMVVKMYEMMGG